MADDSQQDENSNIDDLTEGKKKFTRNQFGFEGVNLSIFKDGDELIYHDLDEDRQYTLKIDGNENYIYTDVETGESFYVETKEEEDDEMDREEMETKYNGSFDITIHEGGILKDMIANLHFLSTSVYVVAKKDAFFFLMISERDTISQPSGKTKKAKQQTSDDNTIYSIVKVNTDKVTYKFNDDIEDPELREESMIVMEVGGDVLHSKVSSLGKDHMIRFSKKKGEGLSFESISSKTSEVFSSGFIDFTLRCETVSDYGDSYLDDKKRVGDIEYSVGYKAFCDAIKEIAKQSIKNSTIDICCSKSGQGMIIVNRKIDAENSLNHAHPVKYRDYSIAIAAAEDFLKKHREHRTSDRIARHTTKLSKFEGKSNLLIKSRDEGILLIAENGAMKLISCIVDI